MNRWAVLLLSVCISSCANSDDSAVAVSVIGPKPQVVDPNRAPLDPASEVLMGATVQGLVSFDAQGQVEPALAERWIVTDDGLSYIFRIRRTRWSDGKYVTAQEVVKSLKASLAANNGNPLRASFANVSEIVAMTEHVLEIRLAAPQPSLLPLLAQPEMAVMKQGRGTGPYEIHRRNPNSLVLRPALPDEASEAEASEELLRKSERRVRGDRAAAAVARFVDGDVSLVLGGTFDDILIARAADLGGNVWRRDPAPGVFGLVMSRKNKVLANQEVRRALAMVIDRQAILQRFNVAGWRGSAALLPGPIESAAEPAIPEWVALNRSERLALGRAAITAHQGGEDKELVLRVSMPDGPGGRLLFAQIASDWNRIGVKALRVAPKGETDIRLVDQVAPHGSAFWYFQQLGCAKGNQCSVEADTLVQEALNVRDPAERAKAVAKADQALADAQVFIPIAAPVRWSLVAPRLQGYRDSPFAIHPLNRLMRARR